MNLDKNTRNIFGHAIFAATVNGCTILKSDTIINNDHSSISGVDPSSVIPSQIKCCRSTMEFRLHEND